MKELCGKVHGVMIRSSNPPGNTSERYYHAACDREVGHSGYHSFNLGDKRFSDCFGWPQDARCESVVNTSTEKFRCSLFAGHSGRHVAYLCQDADPESLHMPEDRGMIMVGDPFIAAAWTGK